MNELISVVLPVYNRENTIRRAINSVLNQTVNNLELIIIDDCSTDKTVDIIKKINDDRIRLYINDTNRGACYSRNRGVYLSSGKFVAFQDSDDEWMNNKLEICLEEIKNKKCDLVFSSYLLDDEVVPKYNLNFIDEKFYQILNNNCVSTQTIFAKKEVFINEPFDETMPRYQDYELMLRIINKYIVYFIDKPLVKVYLQDNSITRNSKNGVIALKRILEKNIEHLNKNKKSAAFFYSNLGVHCEKAGESGAVYFKLSLKNCFDMIVFTRYLLSKLKLYKIVDSRLGKQIK